VTRTVSAVIGANYGDEGKGHLTNTLTTGPGTLVVRYNGGAQAGHTVVHDGRRHVFHHFGSGSLKRATTYLSKYFIINPMFFKGEFEELGHPNTIVDMDAIVTTPYDIMLNQAAEAARSGGRHGSCGLGINETVTRNEHDRYYKFTVRDLLDGRIAVGQKLRMIRSEWVPLRAKQLGIDLKDMPHLNLDGIVEKYIDDATHFVMNVRFTSNSGLIDHYDNVIFEGAQGLRLDELGKDFPHVTRSRTGSPNIIKILQESEIDEAEIDVHYVTRPYITRHGAGPLSHEITKWPRWPSPAGIPYPGVVDKTNVPNEHQGTLRFAWFDVDEFAEYVNQDKKEWDRAKITMTPYTVFSCIDQLGTEKVTFFEGGVEKQQLFEWFSMAVTSVTDSIGAFLEADGHDKV
jgi:adenylosuccinate synthase